jgi:hypothetical protein
MFAEGFNITPVIITEMGIMGCFVYPKTTTESAKEWN